MNLLHELAPGPDVPNVIYVVVEVPKGSRNKYEYDKERGFVKLDRVLYSPIHYPGDYGLIPSTHYDDGDALDVLVMVNEPTFPGCIIEARPIGLFRMLDRGVADDKVLAVPYTAALSGRDGTLFRGLQRAGRRADRGPGLGASKPGAQTDRVRSGPIPATA